MTINTYNIRTILRLVKRMDVETNWKWGVGNQTNKNVLTLQFSMPISCTSKKCPKIEAEGWGGCVRGLAPGPTPSPDTSEVRIKRTDLGNKDTIWACRCVYTNNISVPLGMHWLSNLIILFKWSTIPTNIRDSLIGRFVLCITMNKCREKNVPYYHNK